MLVRRRQRPHLGRNRTGCECKRMMDARSSTACRVPAAAAHGEGESCAE